MQYINNQGIENLETLLEGTRIKILNDYEVFVYSDDWERHALAVTVENGILYIRPFLLDTGANTYQESFNKRGITFKTSYKVARNRRLKVLQMFNLAREMII